MQKLGVLAAMLSIFLSAYGFKVNGIYYSVTDPAAKEVEVTSEIPYGYHGDVVVPPSVSYEGEDYKVTAIGNSTFAGCFGLTSVTIPNTVTAIGELAFYGCNSLIKIDVADDNQAYLSKDGVLYNKSQTTLICCPSGKTGDFNIPNTVTTIGDEAFSKCIGLTSITIPNTVTTIGDDAFHDCFGLSSITIPNSVTSIGEWAFANCSGLSSITIPNSVTTIKDSTFSGCNSLTSITIPNTVTTIGDYTFEGCSSLRSITIPNSVTTIGEEIFSECRDLRSITIPGSVTSIGDNAFYNCSYLTNIDVAVDNQSYSSKDGVLYNKSQTTLICCPCGKEGDIVISNMVTTIVEGAFSWCSDLTDIEVAVDNQTYSSKEGILYNKSQTTLICCPGGKTGDITIPNTVTTIGDGAFYGCDGLTSITIPNTVTTIGNGAFYWCYGLYSITIPNTVTTIGNYAFYNCSGLNSITSLAVTPPDCGDQVFERISTMMCTLYVPAGRAEAYKQAPGWNYFEFVEEEEGTGIGSIEAGSAAAATAVFNLAGVKVADTLENLPAGIYIVREGSTSRKIVVR